MDILAERFRALALVVGPDFSLGRGREGSLPVLTELGAARGIAVNPVSPRRLGRERISSSMIRKLVHAGDVRGAARLLGHPPTVRGPVVRGDGRGRQLGIPTANLAVPAGHCLPPNGIYACLATLPNGSNHAAAVSIGTRPTFGTGPRTVEAFLLDFVGDLYDREITLAFVERLRDELRFDSVAELLAQIDRDVAETRDLIGRFRAPSRAEPVPSA
jgi:riboflavin kinase/FMN adenylyltransferase